jgi:hypothetical protein
MLCFVFPVCHFGLPLALVAKQQESDHIKSLIVGNISIRIYRWRNAFAPLMHANSIFGQQPM